MCKCITIWKVTSFTIKKFVNKYISLIQSDGGTKDL